MNLPSKLTPVAAFFVALTLLLFSSTPAVGATAPPSGDRIIPPLGTTVMQDPSGTYWFTNLPNGAYSTDLVTYEKLLGDPYAGISGSQIEITGNTVTMVPTHPEPSLAYVTLDNVWGGCGRMLRDFRFWQRLCLMLKSL